MRHRTDPVSRHRQLQFQQVSPMLPVYSVTDLPGCSACRARIVSLMSKELDKALQEMARARLS